MPVSAWQKNRYQPGNERWLRLANCERLKLLVKVVLCSHISPKSAVKSLHQSEANISLFLEVDLAKVEYAID
jgi:hypothetical protein